MDKRCLFIALFVLFGFTGCASTGHYHWGHYETSLYQYYKNPADVESFSEELAEVIEKGIPDDRVPPGIYAEYGYILFLQGKNKEAITCFQKEKEKWPESTHLMDNMMANVKADEEEEQLTATESYNERGQDVSESP